MRISAMLAKSRITLSSEVLFVVLIRATQWQPTQNQAKRIIMIATVMDRQRGQRAMLAVHPPVFVCLLRRVLSRLFNRMCSSSPNLLRY